MNAASGSTSVVGGGETRGTLCERPEQRSCKRRHTLHVEVGQVLGALRGVVPEPLAPSTLVGLENVVHPGNDVEILVVYRLLITVAVAVIVVVDLLLLRSVSTTRGLFPFLLFP